MKFIRILIVAVLMVSGFGLAKAEAAIKPAVSLTPASPGPQYHHRRYHHRRYYRHHYRRRGHASINIRLPKPPPPPPRPPRP